MFLFTAAQRIYKYEAETDKWTMQAGSIFFTGDMNAGVIYRFESNFHIRKPAIRYLPVPSGSSSLRMDEE